MKTFRLVLFLVVLSLTGCTTLQKPLPVQQIFTHVFPPTFRGDAKFVHKNTWFDVSIEVTNLRLEDGVWRYATLSYKRNDRFSSGDITVSEVK